MNKKSLAFTVELIGLFILLIVVIVIITETFVMSRTHSVQARHLTVAVMLAENAAEAAGASETMEDLTVNISKMGNVYNVEGEDPLLACIDSEGDINNTHDDYVVAVTRTTDEGAGGVYAEDIIEVYKGGLDIFSSSPGTQPTPVYTLTAGHFFDHKGVDHAAQD